MRRARLGSILGGHLRQSELRLLPPFVYADSFTDVCVQRMADTPSGTIVYTRRYSYPGEASDFRHGRVPRGTRIKEETISVEDRNKMLFYFRLPANKKYGSVLGAVDKTMLPEEASREAMKLLNDLNKDSVMQF